MPVQIDRMDTSIEITSPSASTPTASERRPASAPDSRAQDALREMVGQLMSDELERFMRNRGM